MSSPVIIGDCTLYNADCREVNDQIGLIESLVTDPPYGMNFQSNHRTTKHKKIANDDSYDIFEWCCNLKASHSKYIFCRWDGIKKAPMPKSVITWVKNNWGMGDLKHEHARQTEICLFYPGVNHFFPGKRPSDVLHVKRTGNNLHPTEKPVSLMQMLVRYTDGIVYDPFMGSAATAIACQNLDRKFIGVELDNEYFDKSCERIQKSYDRRNK